MFKSELVRYNCLDGHLWLNGLDKCARCGLKWDDYVEPDYDQDGYTW